MVVRTLLVSDRSLYSMRPVTLNEPEMEPGQDF